MPKNRLRHRLAKGLHDRLKRSTRNPDPDHDGPVAIPLSTAEKCVFVLENAEVGAAYLIVINVLSAFWPCRPAAEIRRFLTHLAAGRQRNSDAWFELVEFGIIGHLRN